MNNINEHINFIQDKRLQIKNVQNLPRLRQIILIEVQPIDLPIMSSKHSMNLIIPALIQILLQIKTYHFACIWLLRERYLI